MKKKRKVVSIIAIGLSSAILFTSAASKILMKKGYEHLYNKNSIEYEEQIKEYNKNIEEYAVYISSLQLNGDLEIIIKVLKDMWNSIDGYGNAEDLPVGYYRLSFQEEKKGVCSSFADDFTAKMNAINSDYEAENICVYIDKSKKESDIPTIELDRKILQKSDNQNEESLIKKYIGNHMVSIIKLKDKNITLMVDPTNLYIGIFKNGKITLLNSKDNDFIEYRLNSNLFYNEESFTENIKDYFSSFKNASVSNEEITEEFCAESQKDAYNKVLNLEKNK